MNFGGAACAMPRMHPFWYRVSCASSPGWLGQVETHVRISESGWLARRLRPARDLRTKDTANITEGIRK